MTTRNFPLGTILSITDGRLISRDHIGGVYDILNHMTGDDLYTHALPRAMRECQPHLLAQHPQLDGVVPLNLESGGPDAIWAWLTEAEATYGAELAVASLPDKEHTVIDPVAELKMMRPDMPIVVVDGGSARYGS